MATMADVLTPFLDTHADVFLTHILPRVNAPARACECGIKDVVPESFIGNLVLPQVNRRLRDLVPGYRAAVEAFDGAFPTRLRRTGFREKDVRAALLLNASASIRGWLLEYVTLSREQCIIDDAMQLGSGMTCSLESIPDSQRKICILCAQFCEGYFDESKDVSECRAACTMCVLDYWHKCEVCDRYYCRSCSEEHLYHCKTCEASYSYCKKCDFAGKVDMQLCSKCSNEYCDECMTEGRVDMLRCVECLNEYCDTCVEYGMEYGPVAIYFCEICPNEYCYKCVRGGKVDMHFCVGCENEYCGKCVTEGKMDMHFCGECSIKYCEECARDMMQWCDTRQIETCRACASTPIDHRTLVEH